MGNFDDLAKFVGPIMIEKIVAKFGGRTIHIKKRFVEIQDAYRNEQAYYDDENLSIKDGANRLKCSRQTLINMRAKSKKDRKNLDKL